LFGVELEHYEKMEGRSLTLEGKANRLSKMIRDNLMAAMQGLVFIPLFAGYDGDAATGRIFSYDVAGGRSCLCNGGPKCRHDHRLKQQPGWTVDQLPDSTFRWTTPVGRTYTTEPTRYPI
ncbi:MAG: hypothetical protein ACRDND_32755, partial [Streptosporangiaceae bacterium]